MRSGQPASRPAHPRSPGGPPVQHAAALGQLHAALGGARVGGRRAAAQRAVHRARQLLSLRRRQVAVQQRLDVQPVQQGGQEGLAGRAGRWAVAGPSVSRPYGARTHLLSAASGWRAAASTAHSSAVSTPCDQPQAVQSPAPHPTCTSAASIFCNSGSTWSACLQEGVCVCVQPHVLRPVTLRSSLRSTGCTWQPGGPQLPHPPPLPCPLLCTSHQPPAPCPSARQPTRSRT